MTEQRVRRRVTGAPLRIPRDDVLRVLRRFYGPDRVEEARRELPDPVDTERDAAVLASFRLTMDDLYDAGGMSP